jgi:4-amino-4-deoxy-L-arabinose transferase-like glycosyltransferase
MTASPVPGPQRTRIAAAVTLAAIVVLAALARAAAFFGPFGSGWQWLGAFYGMQARNSLRYGLAATHFAGVLNADRVPPESWVYYVHHPPGTLWSMAASFALFGTTAAASKLPAVLASLALVVVMYFLVARALSRRAGLVAALLTAALPAGASFATHGSELGPVVICFAMLALLLDERERARNPDRPRAALVFAAFLAAALFSWAALSIAAFVALRDLRGRRWRRAALFAAAVPLVLALHLLHVRLATGSFSGGSGGSLADRVAMHGVTGIEDVTQQFGVGRIVARIGQHLRTLFTIPGLIVAAAGLAAFLLRGRIAPLRDARCGGLFLGTLVFALGYSLPFPQAVWFHSYWLSIALPWIALLGGILMQAAGSRRAPATLVAVVLVAISGNAVWDAHAAQMLERTPDYEEFGGELAARTPAGTKVYTSEPPSLCLAFYCDRELIGNMSDRDLSKLVADRAAVAIPSAVFALVTPPSPEIRYPRAALEAFLRARYPVVDVALPRSGRALALFDLAHPKD